MTKTIVTLTGPTCSGKTTLQKLLENKGLSGIVSFTTRKMRQGEVDGVDYFFFTEEEFKALPKNAIVEHVSLNGNHYGILAKEIIRVLDSGKNIVVVVEPKGAKQVAIFCDQNGLNNVSVYVDNPEYVIYRRFLERFYTDEKAVLDTYALRLSNLSHEIREWRKGGIYNLILSSFGPENQDAVINRILNLIGQQ